MGNLLHFFGKQDAPQFDCEQALEVLTLLSKERKQRPKLVQILEPFPPLLSEFLGFKKYWKKELVDFHDGHPQYLQGKGDEFGIQFLCSPGSYEFGMGSSRQNGSVVRLARTCRWTHLVVDYFDFFEQQQQGEKFTPTYLREDEAFRGEYSWGGRNLLRNAAAAHIELETLIEIASYVRPSILAYYHRRGVTPKMVAL